MKISSKLWEANNCVENLNIPQPVAEGALNTTKTVVFFVEKTLILLVKYKKQETRMRILLLLVLTLLSFSSTAQTVVFGKQGEQAMATRLVTLTSHDGEDKTAFLGRVGRFLTNFTQNNKVEGCAAICRTPDSSRWGVVTYTNQSVLACIVVTTCPDGMENTNVAIHSHPEIGSYNLSRTDKAFMRARNDALKNSNVFNIRTYGGFSHFDKHHGPGYLVEDGQLLYFDGSSTSNLGPVANSVLGAASH